MDLLAVSWVRDEILGSEIFCGTFIPVLRLHSSNIVLISAHIEGFKDKTATNFPCRCLIAHGSFRDHRANPPTKTNTLGPFLKGTSTLETSGPHFWDTNKSNQRSSSARDQTPILVWLLFSSLSSALSGSASYLVLLATTRTGALRGSVSGKTCKNRSSVLVLLRRVVRWFRNDPWAIKYR